MNKEVKILVAVVILAVAGVLYWAFSQEEKVPAPAAEETKTAQMSYTGNVLSEERDGKKVWDITAETIEMDPKTNQTMLHNIVGVFYQEDGKTITLKAPKGIYENKTKNLSLLDTVDALTSDGATFVAKNAYWDGTTQLFHAEGNIKVTREDTVLTGDVLDSDVNFSKIKVTGNAHIIKGGGR